MKVHLLDPAARKWWTLGAVSFGLFMIMLDNTVVNVALPQRLDLPGLASSGIGLCALTYALIEANAYGWTSGRILAAFGLAAVMLATFVALELRQRRPMLDLSPFRNPTFAGANLVVLLVALAMFGVFFFVSLYMQDVLGFSAVEAGAAFLPMTFVIILAAPLAGRTSDASARAG